MNNDYEITPSSIIKDAIQSIEGENKKQHLDLIKNYEKLVEINIRNIKRIMNNETNKAFIIYNYGMLIELFLKMVLLERSTLTIQEIGDTRHKIPNLFEKIKYKCVDKTIKGKCEKIRDRSSLVKMSNGNKIDYNNYMDFRYNHKVGEYDLIFINEISDNDIKYIKEVLECIESVMKN